MGKAARVATICQAGRFYGTVEGNLKHVAKLMEIAFSYDPDLVCLPEAFATASVRKPLEELAEPLDGPIVKAMAEMAREHGSYIICPLYTKRGGRIYNSAVVLDRSGAVVGVYDKLHPVTSSHDYTVFEEGITPGSELKVFDLDFGRVGIQICFDIMFPETWRELAERGAKMVVWCSAYNGGFALRAYAYLHRYYVVSSVRTDKSVVVDPLGNVVAETDALKNVAVAELSLDYAVVHYDFNYSVPDWIMRKYGRRVEVRSSRDDALFLVESRDPSLTVEQLQREFGFEPVEVYVRRHRLAYERLLRGEGPLPQEAAHGKRPMYSKME
ncbi:MAG: carbon-nitrogen hydrolase family protein [Thermofilum sp.]|nr:carbon-nitrogen hydrolase family protein [Thermofilum sp.]